MGFKRKVKQAVKRHLRKAFEVGQRAGVDILPRHFYSSIPDIAALKRTREWRQPSEMAGIAGTEITGQLAWVAECCTPELRKRVARGDIYDHACRENGEIGFGPVEALFLYCYIASKRPRRMVQIGAGVSTAVALLAAKEAGHDIEIVCVDPFPTQYLSDSARAGRIKLIAEPAQVVRRESLVNLGEHGMFFVDSTHTVKPGSEVNRIVLEILPHVPPGSDVHFHDIYWPYDYSRGLFHENWFWSESTLVQAFLTMNSRYRILAALSMLHYAEPKALGDLIPGYVPAANDDGLQVGRDPVGHFPASAYLRCG